MSHRLVLKNITHTFEDGGRQRTILNNLNLQVSEGELVAIMGPSGSGKSTFLSIAGALLKPTSGDVLVDGEAINRVDKQELADMRLHKLGFIFQSANLIPYLKVKEQLILVAKLNGMNKMIGVRRTDEILRRLGLEHRSDAYPDKLSGGERQRVAIARALMNDPAVLLADEPTASLDADRGMDVVRMLAGEARELGKSAVIVTHDERILPLCDRILYLENGSLTEQ
ncbi:ABC transporter ATP-binding protein [Paenibacillus sp. BC26]|uniref:ABC transporter ATP-binding protein n=1 Tax=Paenibacillus sp. BC26 TaxID=1881032 RepID=UPI0008DF8AE8|nr:ABC transporter ATP-binding protein [Paenibacillus sp. BC26]SFS65009.1 putative ABC transport system ATP-binding protein [Paenibacillus sp. BC26]